MDRRKIVCVIVIIFVLSAVIYKLNLSKINNNSQEIEEIKLNTKVNRKQFAMYIKENGEYKEYTSSDTFPEGYVIDKNMSKCYDAEDQEIDGITFTGNSNNITVTSGKTAYCYLYFDKYKTAGEQILDNLPADSGLSASTLGDMRRYQGTNNQVKNYICINETGTKCNSGSDEMYRIIGIVEDGPEAGQIKVMKETKYGSNTKWNNKTVSYQCSGTTCIWPNNDLAITLNTTFLNSLPTKVQDKIVARQWYYGDLGYYYSGITAEKMYQIETGQINTTYLDMSTGNEITNHKWQKTSETLKIGLIYLHDYYWQSTQNDCGTPLIQYYSQCKLGWMHLSQNNNTSDYEWTMSRLGRVFDTGYDLSAWAVHPDGYAVEYLLDITTAVRPVFYLSSDVRIKEGGTGEKTNPYTIDIPDNRTETHKKLASAENSGLSTSRLGDMQRYQGTNVKNYICINDDGSKCNSGDDDMYRIIGVVDVGEDEGQIKVIKETKYGSNAAWNDNDEPSKCSGDTCIWPNSDLAQTLNSTFLNSLPTKVQEKIVSRQWYYGDIGYDYASMTADQMYQTETGQINTTYVDMSSGSTVSNQKWQKTSGTSKIGLMYLHDYAYAANSHATSCRSNYDTCKSSWIHLSQNNNISDFEWTMSREGRSSLIAYVFAWFVNSSGNVGDNGLDAARAVRPVFYLSSDVKIKSGGTGEKTNPYILDLS